MSTKIYHGYYTTLSMSDLLKKFNEFGGRFRKRVDQAAMKLMGFQFIEYVDCGDFEIPMSFDVKKIRKEHILMDIYRLMVEDYEKAQQLGVKSFTEQEHWTMDASVFPTLSDGKTLILAFDNTNQNVFEASFADIVKPYFYFNNQDKPKEITDEEWEKRRKDWDSVLEYGNIPRENSFTYQFHPVHLALPIYDDLLKYIPDMKTREKLIRAQLPEGTSFDPSKIRKIETVEDIKSVLEFFEKKE